MARIAQIYRYPVKGLSAEPLASVALDVDGEIPFDRAYAIENGPSGFDPQAPQHIPKTAFLMLMRNERLAELETRFDETTRTLSIRKDGVVVAEGCLNNERGRSAIEAFFEDFAAEDLRGPPKVLHAPGFTFSDTRPPKKVVSIINLESVRAVGREIAADVHPLRFRGNLYVDGLTAWEEFSWVGKRIEAGDIVFQATKRIDRCAATDVNPVSGARDLSIPRSLMKAFGHIDCGVYLRVLKGGELAVGDTIAPTVAEQGG